MIVGKRVGRSVGSRQGINSPFRSSIVYYAPLGASVKAAIGSDASVVRSGANLFSPTRSTLDSAATDKGRFEDVGGILLESSAQNEITRGNDLTHADWTKLNGDEIVTSGITDPLGGSGAFRLEIGGASGFAIYQTGVTDPASGSAWIKSDTITEVTIGPLLGDTCPITSDWKRCSFNNTANSGAFVLGFAGDVGDTIDVYCPQNESTTIATSSILTGAATTRNTEYLDIPVTQYPGSDQPVAIAFTLSFVGDTGSDQEIMSIVGEGTPSRIEVNLDGSVTARLGATANTGSAGVVSISRTKQRFLLTGNGTDWFCYVNGVQAATAAISGVSGTPTSIRFNWNNTAFIHMSEFTIYNRYFSASEAKHG